MPLSVSVADVKGITLFCYKVVGFNHEHIGYDKGFRDQ